MTGGQPAELDSARQCGLRDRSVGAFANFAVAIPAPQMPPPLSEQARWFADNVQPHEPALRAYLHTTLGSFADVDDVVQETYARLLRARERGPDRVAARAALCHGAQRRA